MPELPDIEGIKQYIDATALRSITAGGWPVRANALPYLAPQGGGRMSENAKGPEVIQYYLRIAPIMLSHINNRPPRLSAIPMASKRNGSLKKQIRLAQFRHCTGPLGLIV